MNAKVYWENFWSKYRLLEARSVDDLYFQVGKTVNKRPISQEIFLAMIMSINQALALTQEDTVIDLCCGNGLVTYELSPTAKEIFAVDFANHLIETANQLRFRSNISYIQGDAISEMRKVLASSHSRSIKILMHDALAYFEPQDLYEMLVAIHEFSEGRTMRLFVTGIPDDERKWNFYDTPERKQRYLENTDRVANDGMGRWWSRREIAEACAQFPFKYSMEDQPSGFSTYRMNLLVESKASV